MVSVDVKHHVYLLTRFIHDWFTGLYTILFTVLHMILCSFIHDFIQLYTILCTALIHYFVLVYSVLHPRYLLLSTLLFTLYSLLFYCCIYCNRPCLTPCSVLISGDDTHLVLLTIPDILWRWHTPCFTHYSGHIVAVTHTLFYSPFRTYCGADSYPVLLSSVPICGSDTYPVLLTVPCWPMAATHTIQLGKGPRKAF